VIGLEMIRSIEPPLAANGLWMLKQTVVGRRSAPNLDSRTFNGAEKEVLRRSATG
jgi:hypothetical protein